MTISGTKRRQPVGLDEVAAALADEHRRAALRVLDHHDGGAMDVDSLAEHVAIRMAEGGAPGNAHRRRIRIALHQTHLPKLAAYGLIDYDTESKQARSNTDDLARAMLDVLESHRTSA